MRSTVDHPQLSVQLYTVREAIQENLAETLARVAAIGFEQVEPYGFPNTEGLGDALRAAGLTAPTGHAHFVAENDAELNRVFASANSLGIDIAIDPHVGPERWQTEESVRAIAAELGHAATIAAGYGVTVGYHNHAHEFESHIAGQTAFEFFADVVDPAVRLEVDTYWATVGGSDPVAVLNRLGDRVAAIHVKDGPGTPDTKDQVAVGSGSLPIRDILAAAPHALRIVELDDSRVDRFTAITDSFNWLVAEGLV